MKTFFNITFLFLLSLPMVSQTITGKVYDDESTIKGAKIYNKNKKTTAYTDDRGNFSITASISDTLVLSSYFHHKKIMIITKAHLKGTTVVELKKVVNNLDEVLLTKAAKEKAFNENEYKANLQMQIQNDIKQNPYKYSTKPSGNIDFVKIASLIVKLFKKKKKKTTPIITTSYKAFDSLFTNDTFFNNKLLTNELQIKKEYRSLFFDYCDAKRIDKKLLKKENQFFLLDTLINCSKEFLQIVKASQNDSSLHRTHKE